LYNPQQNAAVFACGFEERHATPTPVSRTMNSKASLPGVLVWLKSFETDKYRTKPLWRCIVTQWIAPRNSEAIYGRWLLKPRVRPTLNLLFLPWYLTFVFWLFNPVSYTSSRMKFICVPWYNMHMYMKYFLSSNFSYIPSNIVTIWAELFIN